MIVTATRRDACLEHLTNERFDVVVACEKLRDFTGLELLSEVETHSPHTLRIFAAPAERLARLGSRLDHFGLLGTLSYPLEPRKLLLALKVARTKLPPRPKVRHVVLESEWDTGERLGLLEQELEVEPAAPPTLAAALPEDSIAVADQRSIPVAPMGGVQAALAAPRLPIPVAAVAVPVAEDIPVIESLDATSVSQVRRVRELPPAEASFEVSFEENPTRMSATAPRAPDPKPTHPTRPGGTRKATQGSGSQPATKAPATPSAQVAGTRPSPSRGESRPNQTVDISFDVQPGLVAAPAKPPVIQTPPPPAERPPALPVDTDLAANDPAFATEGGEKTVAKPESKSTTTAQGQPSPAPTSATKKAAKKATPTGPQPRQPSVPTAAQRQAFQRAVARRNAARHDLSGQSFSSGQGFSGRALLGQDNIGDGGANAQQPIDASGTFRPHWHGTHSLTDLARIATTKRPLTQTNRPLLPKRKVFVVGSGVAAVLLASVLAFELTGSHAPTQHSRRAVAAQLFSPNSNLVAENNSTDSPPQVFGAPPAQPGEVAAPSRASNLPQPEVFDPNTAPEDPPPPPALERPGPMEPPSMGHSGPPLGMQDGSPE